MVCLPGSLVLILIKPICLIRSSKKMEEQGRNGGQEDIYSFKTDSPMGSDSSDPDSKVNRTSMASVKYKRKLWRNSTDDEDEVPCIKPCIVLLQRSKVSCLLYLLETNQFKNKIFLSYVKRH